MMMMVPSLYRLEERMDYNLRDAQIVKTVVHVGTKFIPFRPDEGNVSL